MLSILIPVYNFDVTDLVNDLHREALELSEKVEIVLVDDGSNEKWKIKNRLCGDLKFVRYEELTKNLGRSAIRNYLSEKANFEFLLFLDNDQATVSNDFLQNYLSNLHPEKVTVGGRCYGKDKPKKEFILHWVVGKNREEIPAELRKKILHDSFLSCNFVIPKAIFQKIKFDESLTQYGHEDTLFGLELEQHNVDILHIDNPLEHLGLESAQVFLDKSKKAIENLVFLHQKTGFSNTKLIHMYLIINRLGLSKLVLFILDALNPILAKNLKSAKPKLLFFDLFKLGVFLKKSI